MAGFRDLRARLAGRGLDLKTAVVAGTTANTNITVSGIKPGDVLVSVLEFQPPTAASGNAIVADRAGNTTITDNDTIQISVATTGNQLLVLWWSV